MITDNWQSLTGTANNVGLCGECGVYHVLGYGCPTSTAGMEPGFHVSQGWVCTDGHRFHAVDQQGHWLLFCRRCGDVRPLKENP